LKYSQEFKDKCKRLFPDWDDLHSRVEQGQTIVGRYLDDASNSSISTKTILGAKSLLELQGLAEMEKEKTELYSEWCELYRKETGVN